MKTENKLKPCPFCGNNKDFKEGQITFGQSSFGKSIKCSQCLVEMPPDYVGDSAIEKWNKRCKQHPPEGWMRIETHTCMTPLLIRTV